MTKKRRKYNPNLIRKKHSYDFKEIAEVYTITTGTVQRWRRQGLNSFGKDGNRYLFCGEEIRRFLKEKALKRKHPLKNDEFFCPKCRKPRKSLSDKLSVEITNKRLGKTAKQVFIRGICEICKQPLIRFSSDRQVQIFKDRGLLLSEHRTIIIGSGGISVNADIKRGEKC